MDVPQNPTAVLGPPDPRLSRLDRLRHARSWSFQGPVGGFGAAFIAGFDPVGQVFGTAVMYFGAAGLGCFAFSARSATPSGRTSANPHNPLLGQLIAARTLALERAVAECRALDADGIIGARLSCTNFLSDSMEFTVEGTAVRARSQTRPDTPFTTHVSGQDLAKLLQAGWMPFALVFGVAIASCHFDSSMFQQTRRSVGAAGNREVSGYTRLINDARREARRALGSAVLEQGGEGAVVQEMTRHFTERECPTTEERADYVVEATVLGSAIVSFERSEPAAQRAPLTIMRLDPRSRTTAETHPGPVVTAGPSPSDRVLAYLSARRDGQDAPRQSGPR